MLDTDYGTFHYKKPEKISPGRPLALFLHGGSRRSQHTEFWTPILGIMSTYTSPILIDRFGHGKSTGSGGLQANDEVIEMIIQAELVNHNQEMVYLVGRSAGTVFCIRQWIKNPQLVKGLGLIAPASMSSYATKLNGFDKKLSVLWDVDDPVVAFSNYDLLREEVPAHELFTIGESQFAKQSASRDIAKSHVPELKAPDLFELFLKNLVA